MCVRCLKPKIDCYIKLIEAGPRVECEHMQNDVGKILM